MTYFEATVVLETDDSNCISLPLKVVMIANRFRSSRAAHAAAWDHQIKHVRSSNKNLGFADNRAEATQLAIQQDTLQLANKNSRMRQNRKIKAVQTRIALERSKARVAKFGENWEVLEIADYLKRHQLRQSRVSQGVEKTVMALSDGSVILIDVNQYWRHQSATEENAYYDSAHVISADSTRTHFWTKHGYAMLTAA